MDRRTVCAALASLVVVPVSAFAQARVFLDYTQDALDKAYDQRIWAPNARQVIARYATDSAAVRKRFPPTTERYGPTEAETLDIFAPAGARNLPVMVFVHGGAWRALSKDDASAPAPTFIENGCLYVALNFANVPAVRLPDMAEQCRRAILWVHERIAGFGGDPNRIFVAGHSSGAHLAAVLLTTDWFGAGGPTDVLKGGLVMSGMYELYPVLLSARSAYVKISGSELAALSPMRHLDHLSGPVIVVSGSRESPEFHRQAAEFATVLAGMGRLSARIEMADKNHFEVPEALNDPASDVSKTIVGLMHTG